MFLGTHCCLPKCYHLFLCYSIAIYTGLTLNDRNARTKKIYIHTRLTLIDSHAGRNRRLPKYCYHLFLCYSIVIFTRLTLIENTAERNSRLQTFTSDVRSRDWRLIVDDRCSFSCMVLNNKCCERKSMHG